MKVAELFRAAKNTHIPKYGKNKPMSGDQEILDQNFLYIIIEKICKTSSLSMEDRSHVYVQTSYMKSISNCNLKTDAP